MKIAIAGCGNMGKTYASSFISGRILQPADLELLEHLPEKAEELKALGFPHIHLQAGSWLKKIDLLILAVKPQDTPGLFEVLHGNLSEDTPVLSIMAGVKMETLSEKLFNKKILRAMPNLPAQIGMGMTGFTAMPEVTRAELLMVQNLLATTGKTIYFDDEEKLDAVTAISGSGPAYVFYIMQAMMDKAFEMGFSPREADLLVEQTFLGAINLLSGSKLTCREWIDRVASKGGTTEAALKEFGLREIDLGIGAGLAKALERAKELGS